MGAFGTSTLYILFATVLTATISFALQIPYESHVKESVYEHYDPIGDTHKKQDLMNILKNTEDLEKKKFGNNEKLNVLLTVNDVNNIYKAYVKVLSHIDTQNFNENNIIAFYLYQCLLESIIKRKNEDRHFTLTRNDVNIPNMSKIKLIWAEYKRYYDAKLLIQHRFMDDPTHNKKSKFVYDWIDFNKKHEVQNEINEQLKECLLNLLNELSIHERKYNLKRELDPLGGANLHKKELDPLEGTNFLKRELDPLGGANLLKRQLDPLRGTDFLKRELDPLGGANLLRRELDPLGGPNLLKRELDQLDGANFLKKELDLLGEANLLKRELDQLGGANLLIRELDSLGGPNLVKKELDPLGGANLLKRELGRENIIKKE